MTNQELQNQLKQLERRLTFTEESLADCRRLLIATLYALGFVDVAHGTEEFKIALQEVVRQAFSREDASVPEQRGLRRLKAWANDLINGLPKAWYGPSPTWPAELPQKFNVLQGPPPGSREPVSSVDEVRYLGNLTDAQWKTLNEFNDSARRAGRFLWDGETLRIRSWHGTGHGENWRDVSLVVTRIPDDTNEQASP
jgi:hypothetical protein